MGRLRVNGDDRDLTPADEELAGELTRLGPLMREQEQTEAEIDQVFARALRARLMRQPAASPVWAPGRRRPIAWMGGAAAALLTLLVSLFLALLGPGRAHAPAFVAPYPSTADLVFSFPAPAVVIHRLSPTLSLVHLRPGLPYAGHLRLSASRLPSAPPQLHAYRLAPPSSVMPLGRRLLGIHSHARRVAAGSAPWVVAADGGFPSRRPLHSLALSLSTGELIYHDRRNLLLPRATGPLPPSTAIRVARRWLDRLGWPGSRMPLVAVESAPNRPKVREVEFGWIGVGRTATDAATLWVTPSRSVIEAWVWPPVARGETIPARSLAAAWTDVRAGRLPLAVEGVPPTSRNGGAGTVRRTGVVSILSSRAGALYLVPTYRFEGKAHILGASVHTWYSLAPGARR
jgi:hypothetical protein